MLTTTILKYKYNKKNVIIYWLAVFIFFGGIFIFLLPNFGIVKTSLTAYHPILFASVGELFIFSFALFFNIRRMNIEKNELIKLTAQQEKEILTAQIKGDESASARISSELHDNIGSRLALIKNKLLGKNQNIKEISKEVGSVYKDVRDISHRLSSNAFFLLGCETAIESYAEEVSENSLLDISVDVFCGDDEGEIDNETALQLFRIIQEVVLNAQKHAGKAQVSIILTRNLQNITLTIEDNGKGIDNIEIARLKGNGINNIQMRAKLLGGTLKVISKINEGTAVIVQIPVADN